MPQQRGAAPMSPTEFLRQHEQQQQQPPPPEPGRIPSPSEFLAGQQQQPPPTPTAAAAAPAPEGPSLRGFAGNIVSSGAQQISNIAEMFLSPFQTAKGLGMLALGAAEKMAPPRAYGTVFGPGENPVELVLGELANRYGGVENVKRTVYQDPVGVLADLSTIMGGGGGAARLIGRAASASKIGRVAAAGARIGRAGETLGKAAQTIDPVVQTVRGAVGAGRLAGRAVTGGAQGLGKAATSALGFTTGTPPDYVRRALHPSDTFKAAMHGEIDVTDIANNAIAAVKELRKRRGDTYRAALAHLPRMTLDMTPVMNALTDQLNAFRVYLVPRARRAGGTVMEPDFATSQIGSRTARREIRDVIHDVLEWPDRTCSGCPRNAVPSQALDDLKQRLDNYYSETSQANKLIAAVRSSIRQKLGEVPGYNELTTPYEQMSQLLREIQPELSIGPKTALGTTARKIVGALNRNADFRQMILKSLDTAAGSKLQDQLAGYAMSRWWPRGLVATGTMATLLYSMGLSLDPVRILGLMLTSPRMVGETLSGLALPARAAGAAAKPAQAIARPAQKIAGRVGPTIRRAVAAGARGARTPGLGRAAMVGARPEVLQPTPPPQEKEQR